MCIYAIGGYNAYHNKEKYNKIVSVMGNVNHIWSMIIQYYYFIYMIEKLRNSRYYVENIWSPKWPIIINEYYCIFIRLKGFIYKTHYIKNMIY